MFSSRWVASLFFSGSFSPLVLLAKRFLWTVPVVTVLGFLASGLEGLAISLLIPILALGLPSSAETELPTSLAFLSYLPMHIDESMRVPLIAAAIFLLAFLKAVVFGINSFFIAWIDGRVSHIIRSDLANRLLNVGYPFFLVEDPARLLTVLSTESWRASDAVRLFFSMISSIGAVAVFCLLLAAISWQLFLLVAVGSALIRLLHGSNNARLKKMSRRFVEANNRLADRMVHVTSGAIRSARIFGQERREQGWFDDASEEVRRSALVVERLSAVLIPSLELMYTVLFIAVLVGAYVMEMSGPVLVTFLAMLYRMQPHAYTIGKAKLQISAIWASIEEVEWLLDRTDKPVPPQGDKPFTQLAHSIRFDNVSFRYPNSSTSTPSINDASFEIRANTATALVGRSGAGKSTIAQLLSRLLHPTEGVILVDGVDLSEIAPDAWRGALAIAGQDIDLMDGTIAENIAYGVPQASLEQIQYAARLADAHEFVSALASGYDTLVGARGLSLSGGQRQRIGIARAIIREPNILILDEATNAVDVLSETTIMALLAQQDRAMTTIVISHRETTLALCENIISLEHGYVVSVETKNGAASA
jgi:subfamily B ATP-binding cassette protein MsbA